MKSYFNYTAVIRTLGKAGEKYQILLNSLMTQSIKPQKIIVYIAESYPLPKETIGIEQYVYVKKGMVAQRALQYTEVESEYILFLDDDVFLPKDSVESMYKYLIYKNADIISPDVFNNSGRSIIGKILMAISGRMIGRKDDGLWGYKVLRSTGYSYNNNPKPGVYWSQTNAGPCFFCRKEDFLKIHYEDELWMDTQKYAMGDDQVMFYKMYLSGLKQLTWFNSGIMHLDAGTTMVNNKREKETIYSDLWIRIVFWYRFIYSRDNKIYSRVLNSLSFFYFLFYSFFVSLVKFQFNIVRLKFSSLNSAISFINSDEYKKIPNI